MQPVILISRFIALLKQGIMLERIKAMEFYKKVTCYEMMPESGKIVVLETRLHVKKAFNALLTNGIRAALLWDSATQQYVGMITITDFIKILRKYYVSPLVSAFTYKMRECKCYVEH